jgi:hypothetical protein
MGASDLWEFDEIEFLVLHSGEYVQGPFDVMRDGNGAVYGFRRDDRFSDRRVFHVAAVKFSQPIPRLVIPRGVPNTGDFDSNGFHFGLNGKLVSREEWEQAVAAFDQRALESGISPK